MYIVQSKRWIESDRCWMDTVLGISQVRSSRVTIAPVVRRDGNTAAGEWTVSA